MKNRIPLIITAAIIILVILSVYFWMSGIISQDGIKILDKPSGNVTPKLIITNNSLDESPPDLDKFKPLQVRLGFSKWKFDPVKKEMTLYAYDIQDENAINNLQGKRIDNYTIKIIPDKEFETTRAEVYDQLWQLRQNPDYQLARISMVTDAFGDPPGYYAELWVYHSTSENRKLDNTTIKGWRILVYPMAPLPKETGTPSPLPIIVRLTHLTPT